MEEIWKDIEGYEGLYQVSNLGRVKSLRRNIILKSKIERNGYERVILSANNNTKGYSVHRLVATAFISNPNNYPIVNHKDENRANNCVNNLEWCTQKHNVNYGTGIAKRVKSQSKKVLQFNPDGTFVKEWESTMEIGRAMNKSQGHIVQVCNGQRKTAYGYLWKYKKEMD